MLIINHFLESDEKEVKQRLVLNNGFIVNVTSHDMGQIQDCNFVVRKVLMSRFLPLMKLHLNASLATPSQIK